MPKQATLPESTAQATVEAERATSKPSTTLPEYIERNRAAWDRWAPAVAGAGARAWRRTELEWGLWESPEYHLQLLARVDKPRADIVELGCGTAAISAWLRRLGARPVAVDFSQKQLATAERLQAESDVHFPLISRCRSTARASGAIPCAGSRRRAACFGQTGSSSSSRAARC
jgi:2-polyprenyl-3-methyl-5-hydroxy-6-metoxy-1,4-benzoquinol methylase